MLPRLQPSFFNGFMKLRDWLSLQTALLAVIAFFVAVPPTVVFTIELTKALRDRWSTIEPEAPKAKVRLGETPSERREREKRTQALLEKIPGCSRKDLGGLDEFSDAYYSCLRKLGEVER